MAYETPDTHCLPNMQSHHCPQVDPAHYRKNYDHRRRFLSYWNQIDFVRRSTPQLLLEVGIGNGFVSRYLREIGVSLHTVDYDERLAPDTVASVVSLPFETGSFDVVCCFETLEHLPWDQFVPALKELRRVASRQVLLSLPDVTPYFHFRLGWAFRLPLFDTTSDSKLFRPLEHEFDGQHHWEVGKKGHSLRQVRAAFQEAGLHLNRMRRDPEDPYHRFFECSVAG